MSYRKTFIRDLVMFPITWFKHLWLIDKPTAKRYYDFILVEYWGKQTNPVVRWTISYLQRKSK